MTETTDPVREFYDALTTFARTSVHRSQTNAGRIYAAVHNQHWTVADLARECSRDLNGALNAGAVITTRLGWCADHPPISRAGLPVIPLCGRCDAGWVVDPDTSQLVGRCPCRTVKESA
jgi:hypothetical protein